MLWSSLNKFKLFTTYHNHVVRGGQLKIESFQAGSHMYNTKRLFLKTPENILKYTNFIGRNVILNFYKIDIYLLSHSSQLRQSYFTWLEKKNMKTSNESY